MRQQTKIICAFALAGGLLGGCASHRAAPAASSAENARAGSDAQILEKFGWRKLRQAAVLLQSIEETAADAPGENPGQNAIGCAISKDQAHAWRKKVEALAEKQAGSERDDYSIRPQAYSAQFARCAPTCLCEAYLDILQQVEPARPEDRAFHAATMKKLKIKAKITSAAARLACARDQSWFCESELKAYLEKE